MIKICSGDKPSSGGGTSTRIIRDIACDYKRDSEHYPTHGGSEEQNPMFATQNGELLKTNLMLLARGRAIFYESKKARV